MPAFAAIRSAVERPNPSAKKTSRATRRIFLESACEACRVGLPVRPEACSLVFWVDVMPHLGHTLSALQASNALHCIARPREIARAYARPTRPAELCLPERIAAVRREWKQCDFIKASWLRYHSRQAFLSIFHVAVSGTVAHRLSIGSYKVTTIVSRASTLDSDEKHSTSRPLN